MSTAASTTSVGLRTSELLEMARDMRLACCMPAAAVRGGGSGGSCSFLGVFAADKIPSLRTLVFRRATTAAGCSRCDRLKCFVANIDPMEKPGQHWVAFVVFASRPRSIYYFDSYAMPLSFYSALEQQCVRSGYFADGYEVRPVASEALQASTTAVCGHYSLLFLYLCARVSLRGGGGGGDSAAKALQLLVSLVSRAGTSPSSQRDALLASLLRRLLLRHSCLVSAFDCSSARSRARNQCCAPRV